MHRILVIPAALALLSGCLSLAKDYPERHLHAISAPRPEGAAAPAQGAILHVKLFTIASRYAGTEFVYRRSDIEWESDFYHAFFVAPREALTDESRAWITGSGIVSAVVDGSSAIPPTHLVEGHIAALYADVRTPGALKAVIELEVMLVDDRRVPPAALMSRRYSQAVAMREDTPEALVAGWNARLSAILRALEADLREALAAPR